jgi:hypothetical protein
LFILLKAYHENTKLEKHEILKAFFVVSVFRVFVMKEYLLFSAYKHRAPMCLEMTMRCTSDVPSPISSSFWSR